MKKTRPILLQAAVWGGLWFVFVFTTNDAFRPAPPHFHMIHTIRVAAFAALFNIAYYWLLPLYFSGRKQAFFSFSALTLIAYIALLVFIDIRVGRPGAVPPPGAFVTRQRRLAPLIIPPVFLSLSLFGIAAALRGAAAFERKKQSEEEANRRRLEAEIALLKSQINPHFLLNTLNNLYTLALTDPEKTPDALLKLSEMMQYILYECAQKRVPVAHEIAFIENYIDLQRLRLPPNVQLRAQLPKQVNERLGIEPMILIPFVENAFKHGVTTKGPCEIDIALKIQDARLALTVKNPIVPGKKIENMQASGIGMPNTQQRLAHSYPDRRIDIATDEKDYTITLELQLEAIL